MELNLTNENFSEILNSANPVMVDFWAPWCGPCRAIAPIVEEVANEYEGKAVVVKCNVDECEDVVSQYPVRNIPTLLFFKNGEMVDRLVGAVSKKQMTDKLDALM